MSSKVTRLATISIVVIIGLISPCVCALFGSALETGSLSNSLSKIDALTWGVLLVVSIGVLPDTLASINILKHPEASQQDYSAPVRFLAQFTRYISVAVLICYLLLNQHSGLSSIVGQPTAIGFLSSAFTSLIVFSCFVVIYGLGYRLVHKRKQEVDPADPAVRMVSIQRTILERIVFLPILFLGVISEELLYRGYLVLILGNEVGPALLWALLSILLSVVAHLYQGRSRIIWHLLFAIIATSMTALTGSILMSTTMHLYANSISALKVWSIVDKTTAKQEDVMNSEQITSTVA